MFNDSSPNIFICQSHFDPKDIIKSDNRKLLVENAFPVYPHRPIKLNFSEEDSQSSSHDVSLNLYIMNIKS